MVVVVVDTAVSVLLMNGCFYSARFSLPSSTNREIGCAEVLQNDLFLSSDMLNLQCSIYIYKIAQSFLSVSYLLQNGLMYSGDIWHADACRPCAGPLRGPMSIGIIVW